MSTPWSTEDLVGPFGEFHVESPFASATLEFGGEAAGLPLAYESAEQSTVRVAIAGGTRDLNQLTNLVFFARHPERGGRALSSSEPGFAALGAEWTTIRDTVVRPLLTTGGPSAPATPGDLWVPGAERLANPRSAGGTYVDGPWRFVFHTIEGGHSERAFRELATGHTNPPHLWAMPSANLLLQTIPLNRSGYALKPTTGTETNRLHAIQVELWGYAQNMGATTPDVLNWLADRVLAPVARLVPINLAVARPTGGQSCSGPTSSCRMTVAEWQAFDGVCGHQHVPGNEHWDPGPLNLGAIAARAKATVGGTSYLQRERPLSLHDGPDFVAERDDEDGWRHETGNGYRQVDEGHEGLAELDEVQAFLEYQTTATTGACTFPSGATLRVASGPTGPKQEHWDPNGFNDPLYDTGPAARTVQLAPNFVVSEFCLSGGKLSDLSRISCGLVRNLQKIRDRVGQPVSINSGYRSYQRNIELYESRGQKPTNSQHSSGRAADIAIAGMSGLEIAKLAMDVCGPKLAVGVASSYAHVDVRGNYERWTYFSDPAEDARVKAELDAHHARLGTPVSVP